MAGFFEGADRQQMMLLPECLNDYVGEENPVRVIDAFVEMLDLAALGFRTVPEATGHPGYHPGLTLRIYLYGYLNQVQSSRRLERECGRNLEHIWLTGRLRPDFKTIADFRKDNGPASGRITARPGPAATQAGSQSRPIVRNATADTASQTAARRVIAPTVRVS
jgi:transposase